MKQIRNLSDKGFKTLIIRISNKPQRKIDELSENFNKEIEIIKNN